MMKKTLWLTGTLAAVLVTSGCTGSAVRQAEGGSRPPGRVESSPQVSGRVAIQDRNTRIEVAFNDQDRKYIREYYQREYKKRHKKGMPPGLAKRDRLPPGLQKQVQRNGKLPPGLEGRALPRELERRLSRLPANYVRIQVGTDIVLMDRRSRIAVDVIKDLPM